MPSIAGVLARFTKQKMLYWERIEGQSNPSGQPIFKDPIVINCRWEDKEQEILTKDSRKVISKGYILLGQTLITGSIIMLGITKPMTDKSVMSDWKKTSSFPNAPSIADNGVEVLVCNGTPDIKAIDYVFEAYI